MATHPPLEKRIKRIDPSWKGEFTSHANQAIINEGYSASDHNVSHFSPQNTSEQDEILKFGEEPSAANLSKAVELINTLPPGLYSASHEPFSARAVIYALLLDTNSERRAQQLLLMKAHAHPLTFRELQKLEVEVTTVQKEDRISLINMCMPAMKQLSAPQYHVFKENLARLIRNDKKVSLFEWCLYRICTRTVEHSSGPKLLSTLKNSEQEVTTIFHASAVLGKDKKPLEAVNGGLRSLNYPELARLPDTVPSLQLLDRATTKLESLRPLDKPKFLKALAQVIQRDKKVTYSERELLVAIAESLNCPMPPI